MNESKDLVLRRVDPNSPAGSVPGVPDRATRVASWIGWHVPELTGVAAPAVVAVGVSPWAWVVSGVVGAGWTVHAVRTARQQAAIKAGRDLPTVTDEPSEEDGTDNVEETSTTTTGGAGSVPSRDERVGGA